MRERAVSAAQNACPRGKHGNDYTVHQVLFVAIANCGFPIREAHAAAPSSPSEVASAWVQSECKKYPGYCGFITLKARGCISESIVAARNYPPIIKHMIDSGIPPGIIRSNLINYGIDFETIEYIYNLVKTGHFGPDAEIKIEMMSLTNCLEEIDSQLN